MQTTPGRLHLGQYPLVVVVAVRLLLLLLLLLFGFAAPWPFRRLEIEPETPLSSPRREKTKKVVVDGFVGDLPPLLG